MTAWAVTGRLHEGLRAATAAVPGRRRVTVPAARALARLALLPGVGDLAAAARAVLDQEAVRPPVGPQEVLRVLGVLAGAGATCWLAGGWGLDALAGHATREHGDLDLVLPDAGALPAAVAALAAAGYAAVGQDGSATWLCVRRRYEDAAGRLVELLEVNWPMLQAAAGLLGAPGALDPALVRARCCASGRVAGREVVCLSPAAQRLFHLGYDDEGRDLRDAPVLARVAGGPPAPAAPAAAVPTAAVPTALLVPVLGLAGPARDVLASAAPAGALPPHITLLYPFVDAAGADARVLQAVAAALEGADPVDVVLARTGVVPAQRPGRRVLWLEPEPAAPLVALVDRLTRAFPEHPPYGGAFAEVLPHLTLGDGMRRWLVAAARARAERGLPHPVRADEVWLVACPPDGPWQLLRSFPLLGAGGAR